MSQVSQSPVVPLRAVHPGWQASFIRRLAGTVIVTFFIVYNVAAHAQTSAAGANWDRVKVLPQHTRLHVSADKRGHTCSLMSVSDAALVCGRYSFPRAEIKTVKLTRYGISLVAGAAIGGVALGGLGAAAASGDSFFKHDKASVAGVGAVLGAILGGLIAGPADLFRGPTIYRRP